jgi:hypothetical protein
VRPDKLPYNHQERRTLGGELCPSGDSPSPLSFRICDTLQVFVRVSTVTWPLQQVVTFDRVYLRRAARAEGANTPSEALITFFAPQPKFVCATTPRRSRPHLDKCFDSFVLVTTPRLLSFCSPSPATTRSIRTRLYVVDSQWILFCVNSYGVGKENIY